MQETHNFEHQVPSFASANFNPEVGREQREKKARPKLSTRDEAGRPRSPINGALVPKGRAKGTPNKVTQTLREAVEIAARECHPQGLAGWLVDRAQGGIQDRQIFAGLVGKVIPIQVNQSVQGGIAISLNWLGQRNISGTPAAQPVIEAVQVVEAIEHSQPRHWTTDAKRPEQPALASDAMPVQLEADPPSPVDPGTGGAAETGSPPHPPALQKKDIA